MKTPNKFTIIYSFKVVEGKEKDFINSWAELTKLIYEFEGSYGSRLHKVNSNLFIAYAQWPGKEVYDRSGNNLPESANKYRQQMRECCSKIKTEFELSSVIIDLLKDEQHQEYQKKSSGLD